MFSAPPATTTVSARIVSPPASTPVARPSSTTTRSTGVSARTSSSPRAHVSAMYVFPVDLPAFVGQPCRHEPQCMQFPSVYEVTGSSSWPSALNPRSSVSTHFCQSCALADAEPLLDLRVVRLEIGDGERPRAVRGQPGLGMPLGDVPLVRPQRDLRVDRRRPADTAAGEERDDVAVRQRPEAERPPERVVRLRLPAVEVDRGQVRAGLEQEHVPAARRELAGDDTAASPRPHDDDVSYASSHDQSLRNRRAAGGSKSISAQAPWASRPGSTKSE